MQQNFETLISLFVMFDITNDTDETNIEHNFNIQSGMIDEDISISYEIQIHQNARSDLMNELMIKYLSV